MREIAKQFCKSDLLFSLDIMRTCCTRWHHMSATLDTICNHKPRLDIFSFPFMMLQLQTITAIISQVEKT